MSLYDSHWAYLHLPIENNVSHIDVVFISSSLEEYLHIIFFDFWACLQTFRTSKTIHIILKSNMTCPILVLT